MKKLWASIALVILSVSLSFAAPQPTMGKDVKDDTQTHLQPVNEGWEEDFGGNCTRNPIGDCESPGKIG